MNAAAIAAALGRCAEAVCRHYLPHGRRQGRYWVAGDLDGARGRSLFVRLAPPGTPGKWTDAAEGQHGDLLDLIRYRTGAPTLRAALDEARAFLALPAAPATGESTAYDATGGGAPPMAGVAAPSTAPTRSATSGRGVSRAAASRRCASTPSFATAKARPCAACRRWSPP